MNTERMLDLMSIEKLYGAYWADDPHAPKGILEFGYAGLGYLPDALIRSKVIAKTPYYVNVVLKLKKPDTPDDDSTTLIYEFHYSDCVIAKLTLSTKRSDVAAYNFVREPVVTKKINEKRDLPDALIPILLVRTFIFNGIRYSESPYVVHSADGYNGFGFKLEDNFSIEFTINNHLYNLEY